MCYGMGAGMWDWDGMRWDGVGVEDMGCVMGWCVTQPWCACVYMVGEVRAGVHVFTCRAEDSV